ncbi:hypothetical protein OQA88_2973 [Cercophora sp. LCS_1]
MSVMRLLAVLSALGLARVAESANCYKVDGKLQSAQYGWKACKPEAASSPCCSGIDYCLDNGLCLNAGVVNNIITVQGCTDPSWGGDCRKYCPGSIDGNGYVAISICDGFNNACCGDAGKCCNSGDTFKLPFFTNLTHPPEESATTTQGAPNSSGTTAPSQTTPGGQSASSDAALTGQGSAATSDQALKVGLGVGVSLGALLLAAIGYSIWELRKRRAMAEEMKTMTDHGAVGVVPGPPMHQSPAPKYQPYPHSYPSELPYQQIAQLPAEVGRGELDANPTR